MATADSERSRRNKAALRQRMRDAGYVAVHLWIHPSRRNQLKTLERRMRRPLRDRPGNVSRVVAERERHAETLATGEVTAPSHDGQLSNYAAYLLTNQTGNPDT